MAEQATEAKIPSSPNIGKVSELQIPVQQWTLETALNTLSFPPKQQSSSPLPFFHILELLKTNKREGWRRFGIYTGESISDHMYRMSIITMLAPASLTSRLDLQRCTAMALIHDMAESLVGDITPMDHVSKPEKNRRESTTMDFLCNNLLGNVDNGSAGRRIREIWQEYEDGKTLNSKFVHDVDKLELLLQMVEYERAHKGDKDLSEFSRVAARIELVEVKTWAEEILAEQRDYWKTLEKTPSGETLEDTEMQLEEYYGKEAPNTTQATW